jgi:hypothetical protein
MFHTELRAMLLTQLDTRFHSHSFNGSLTTATEFKAHYTFRAAVYIPHRITKEKLHTFLNILPHKMPRPFQRPWFITITLFVEDHTLKSVSLSNFLIILLSRMGVALLLLSHDGEKYRCETSLQRHAVRTNIDYYRQMILMFVFGSEKEQVIVLGGLVAAC